MRNAMTGLVLCVVATGCGAAADDSAGTAVTPLTMDELQAHVEAGARVEVELADDGSVREIQVEGEGRGHEAQLTGEVVRLLGTTLEVAHLGVVDFSGAQRFRTEEDSSVDQPAWLAALEAELAAGRRVFVDARGAFGPEGFVANEVRWEDEDETKIEADVDAGAIDLAAGIITVGGMQFPLQNAALRFDADGDDDGDDDDDGDGNDDDGDDVGDDNGDDGAEAGDDNGDDGAEAGDDNGDDGAEAGDDNGDDGAEAGDDNGDDGAEAGDDNGDDGAEAGDDNGDDGAEAGDDNGDDGAEDPADDNGDDGAEDEAEDPADDNR